MSEPRNYQTEAIIIKKTKLGEADRVLTFFTPHLGKLEAVARGVRRPRSKMAGHLELLTYSQVSLARGRNLDTIIGSQTINGFLTIKDNLWLTSCALYVSELVNQFTAERLENYPLFQLLLTTLERLCQAGSKELVLHYFELHLLNEAGFQPQLGHCVACRVLLEPVANYFSPHAGGMLCPNCHSTQPVAYPVSVNALKVLRLLQKDDYETVSRLKLEAGLARELEEITRVYFRYLLEREVKSVAWLDNLREQARLSATG